MKHGMIVLRAAIRINSRGRIIRSNHQKHSVILSRNNYPAASTFLHRPSQYSASVAADATNLFPRICSLRSSCTSSANSGRIMSRQITTSRQLLSSTTRIPSLSTSSRSEKRGRRVWKSSDCSMTVGDEMNVNDENCTTEVGNDYWDTAVDSAEHGRMLHESLMRICEQVRGYIKITHQLSATSYYLCADIHFVAFHFLVLGCVN